MLTIKLILNSLNKSLNENKIILPVNYRLSICKFKYKKRRILILNSFTKFLY